MCLIFLFFLCIIKYPKNFNLKILIFKYPCVYMYVCIVISSSHKSISSKTWKLIHRVTRQNTENRIFLVLRYSIPLGFVFHNQKNRVSNGVTDRWSWKLYSKLLIEIHTKALISFIRGSKFKMKRMPILALFLN